MLRDFGRVTVVDLTVSLLGVLAVLPAVLVLAERRAERRARDRGAGAAGSAGARVSEPGPFGVGERPGAARGRGAPRRRPPPPRRRRGRSTVTLDRRRASSCSRSPTSRSTRCAPRRPARAASPPGTPLPPFAAPLALVGPRGRRQRGRRSADSGPPGRAAGLRRARPGHPQLLRAGRARAGRARVPGRAARRRATEQIDVLERVRAALSRTCGSPPWRSAATATTCARTIRKRGWTLPVGLRPRRRGRQRLRASRSARRSRSRSRAARWRAPTLGALRRGRRWRARIEALRRGP